MKDQLDATPYPVWPSMGFDEWLAKCEEKEMVPGLVIRFDGPPGPKSGRFIETELDGQGVGLGKWEQDGTDWLLVLPPELEKLFRELNQPTETSLDEAEDREIVIRAEIERQEKRESH